LFNFVDEEPNFIYWLGRCSGRDTGKYQGAHYYQKQQIEEAATPPSRLHISTFVQLYQICGKPKNLFLKSAREVIF